MNPALLLRQRKFQFGGDVTASQSVSVLGSEEHSYLYVCTTFTVRTTESGFAHEAKGSRVAFEDADKLNDESYREQLARQHLVELANELRLVANRLTTALMPKLEVVAP